jgi:hypothetical protein
MARLSEYNYDLCVEICEKVSDGENIKAVLLSDEKYPTFQTWCNWRREHSELFDLYTRAVQDKSESVDAKIDEIMQKVETRELDHMTARVLIDTLKWKASKYYPKMFGDKVDITTKDESLNKPVNPSEIMQNINDLLNGNNLSKSGE